MILSPCILLDCNSNDGSFKTIDSCPCLAVIYVDFKCTGPDRPYAARVYLLEGYYYYIFIFFLQVTDDRPSFERKPRVIYATKRSLKQQWITCVEYRSCVTVKNNSKDSSKCIEKKLCLRWSNNIFIVIYFTAIVR